MTSESSKKPRKFRLQGRMFGLTYIPLNWSLDTVHQCLDRINRNWVRMRICHEICPDTKKDHIHVAIEYATHIDTTREKYFQLVELNYETGTRSSTPPHIEIKKDIKDFMTFWNYCSKDGEFKEYFKDKRKVKKDIEDTKNFKNQLVNILSEKTVKDAVLNNAKGFKDIVPIIQFYNQCRHKKNARFIEKYSKLEFMGWQKDAYEIIKNRSQGDRKINWYYDADGNCGKTYFMKMVSVRHKEDTLCINGGASFNNLAHQLYNVWKDNEDVYIILINLPRTMEEHTGVYTFIEAVKDEMVTSFKYNGANITLCDTVVMVFANFKPKTTGVISKDRWIIKSVKNPKETA